ncbi:MAG: hypothetical protein AAFP77_20665 [Bacteroidota bacterium]
MVLIPKGIVYAFKNVGTTVGRLRYVFSPAKSIEEMFREMYAVLDTGELTFDGMSDIALRHGQEFVGPPL